MDEECIRELPGKREKEEKEECITSLGKGVKPKRNEANIRGKKDYNNGAEDRGTKYPITEEEGEEGMKGRRHPGKE